jgi:hypothetical protein
MAKFKQELPTDVIKQLEDLKENCTTIFGEMTQAGAEEVKKNVLQNMGKSFKSTKSLEKGLKVTKVYETPSDDGINTFIGFYGYNDEGVPIPLIAMAREYGTYGSNPRSKSNKETPGEKKEAFFRKSFKKKDIERVMQKIQDKYIKGD